MLTWHQGPSQLTTPKLGSPAAVHCQISLRSDGMPWTCVGVVVASGKSHPVSILIISSLSILKKKFASLAPLGRRSRPMAHSPAIGHHGHHGHRACVAHTCSGSRSRPEGVVPGWWMGSWDLPWSNPGITLW